MIVCTGHGGKSKGVVGECSCSVEVRRGELRWNERVGGEVEKEMLVVKLRALKSDDQHLDSSSW